MNTKGYVYILTNPAMPGLVKIGMTTRSVEQRAEELFTSGVPVPFEVYWNLYSPDCAELERTLHDQLSEFRENSSREFFRVDMGKAYDLAELALMEQVREFVSDFTGTHTLVDETLALHEDHIAKLADETDSPGYNIVSAMNELTADELRPALGRYEDRIKARIKARRTRDGDLITVVSQ